MRSPVNDARVRVQEPSVSLRRRGVAQHPLVQDLLGVNICHPGHADVHQFGVPKKIGHEHLGLKADDHGVLQRLHIFLYPLPFSGQEAHAAVSVAEAEAVRDLTSARMHKIAPQKPGY